MPIERSSKRISGSRLASAARRLVDASPLCAIATVSPGGRAHVNTAYFAWDDALAIVWLSAPEARHSRNVRERPSTAIAVFDSHQKWGGLDHGIQLFGSARELRGAAAREADRLYRHRFREAAAADLETYRYYRLRPRSLKLFDEHEFGGGTFVTARVRPSGRLSWERTEFFAAS
jgi:uncharacterized protein YhbP (UPF0306 family)